MIKFNFLLVARRLMKNRLYALISIISISIAFTIVFFLLNYVVHELKTDQFHENKNNIVRIVSKFSGTKFLTHTPAILGPTLVNELPTVENVTQIKEVYIERPIIAHRYDFSQQEKNIIHSDQAFFKIFTFPIVTGNINNFNETPDGIVISESKALKYFGNNNPVGQTLTFDFYDSDSKVSPKTYRVLAVMKDIPSSSTVNADFIFNLKDIDISEYWGSYSVNTYLLLHPNTNIEELTNQITEIEFANFRNKHEEKPSYERWQLQPITNIHFHSGHIEGGSAGSLNFIKILILVSLLVLCVAFFNYLLLNSSLSIKYFNTQTILNFNGASNKAIFVQENIYTFIQIALSLVIAFPMAKLMHGVFGNYLGANHQFILYSNPLLLITIIITCIFLCFFLALLLLRVFTTSMKRIQNRSITQNSKLTSKQYLLVGQIIVFTGLLMSSLVLMKQMNYIQHKDKGCDINNTLSFYLNVQDYHKIKFFKQEVLKTSFIENFTHGETLPIDEKQKTDFIVNENPDNTFRGGIIQGDSEFTNVYQIPILEGRNLDPSKKPKEFMEFFQTRKDPVEVLVNESFAKLVDSTEILGSIIQSGRSNSKGIIVGIVKDFNVESFYNPIYPTVITYNGTSGVTTSFSVKTQEGYLAESRKHIEKTFSDFYPGVFFRNWNYDFNNVYEKDINRTKIISGLTIIIILISLLGLIGWSLLTIENRTKEIGVRKVNGAKVSEILALLNKDFLKWVTFASIIASPIVFFIMNKWLQNFAYRTAISWWVFALAGVLSLTFSLITVSWQCWRAARRNPVEALRYE